MTNKEIQILLLAAGYYNGGIDGDLGPKTMAGVNMLLAKHDALVKGKPSTWAKERRAIAAAQLILRFAGYYSGQIDGLIGNLTREAYSAWVYKRVTGRDEVVERPQVGESLKKSPFPSQSGCVAFYGEPGSAKLKAQLKSFTLPLPMRIDYDLAKYSKTVTLHEKCGESGIAIMRDTIRYYGEAQWRKLGLDRNAGTYNHRKMTGGTKWSTHAYGCAWDLYALPNGLRVKAPQALFSGEAYVPFFKIVESHGWLSLGRSANMDWMHIQATKDLK